MQWTSWANLFFSSWLLFSPFTLGYQNPSLVCSDVLSGLVAGAVSVSDLLSPRPWKKWAVCFAGTWLLFAPLIFWTKDASCYANDTFIGLLLIVCSVALPSQSGSLPAIPDGWSYNPSAWHHRIPVIILAFSGFFLARHMAAFQLGHVPSAWEPFFGKGTERVLTSEVAKFFPVSDAGLGAATYLLEGLSGLVGDTRRWRTMPWMVFLFFILVVPAGVVSIVLIMLQPVVVGAWCTLCLATAVATLISIPPAVDEVFAAFQFLARVRREKKSVWKVFWIGDRETKPVSSPVVPAAKLKSTNGIGLTWALFLNACLGVWIVLTPILFETSKNASNSDYVTGALITTFAVLATAEPIRTIRFINVILGLWVCFTPLLSEGQSRGSAWNHVISGLILIPLSFPKGKIKERYGSWDRYIV